MISAALKRIPPSFWILLSVALAVRVWLWFSYPIFEGNDSDTYIHLANSLKNNLGFSRYNGTRTPGYPFFLALTGAGAGTYLAQLLLGILTTLAIYWIGFRLTRSAGFALTGACLHTLNLQQLLAEAAMLSEALSAFLFFVLIALSLLITETSSSQTAGTGNGTYRVIIGFVAILSVLLASVRPLFLTLPFCIAGVILFLGRETFAKKARTAFMLVAPMMIAAAFWGFYIYSQFNVIGLDSMGGYHKVNHVSAFFEKAPDEYKEIRDIFLKYRHIRISTTGTPINTIWDAIPDLMKATKLNYYSLGRTMGEISDTLIRENPSLYWQKVLVGWIWFWKGGVVWQPTAINNPISRTLAIHILSVERVVVVIGNFVFLVATLMAARMQFILKKAKYPNTIWVFISFLWLTSILQTFAEHGDNPRFLAPAQSLVFIILIGFYSWRPSNRDRRPVHEK